MNDIRLSICIPTYNFGEFIGETLESIIAQAGGDVEIVVGDGASTDNTAEIVKRYQLKFPRLTYKNFGYKGGVDVDIAKTVELAKGDYCWLMSSDDVLVLGAVQLMLDEIESGCDVYLCNRTVCDRKLRPRRRQKPWLSKRVVGDVFHFSEKLELLDYLNNSQSIGALFSYISSIVVNRSKWNEVGYEERFAESNYAHVSRLFSLLKLAGSRLRYVKYPLVLCRGDNDSFLDKGLANRFLIDFDGYRLLGTHLFTDRGVIESFKAVMRREHEWYLLPKLKVEVDDDKWSEIVERLHYYGYSHRELILINLLGSSKILIRILHSVKKLLRI